LKPTAPRARSAWISPSYFDRGQEPGKPIIILRPRWRTPHASSPPRAHPPSHLAALPGWPRRSGYRRGLGPRPADRPSSSPPFPAWRSRRSLPLLRPMWGGHPEARGVRSTSRLGPPSGTPELGCGLDPRDAAPPTTGPLPARGTDLTALVPPGRARPRAGRATTCHRLPAGRAAPSGLADGRRGTGQAADRPARLLVADRR
jgi:hypothetical protein